MRGEGRGEGSKVRSQVWPAILLVLLVLLLFAASTRPARYVVEPDSLDYMYGALSVLHGQYLVDYDGTPRIPRYTPGTALLLAPAAALGGISATTWVPYLLALALGVLAALIAGRVGGPLAAPLAAAAVLFCQSSLLFAGVVMSDLPAAAFGMGQAALLVLGASWRSSFAAGMLGGACVWIRPANLPLVLAGVATGRSTRSYLLGAALPLLALACWQWLTFGSPLVTSYQAAGAGINGQGSLDAFFRPANVWLPPEPSESLGLRGAASGPSVVRYPLQLFGIDSFLSLPGVGLLGLIGALRSIRTSRFARFTVAAVLATLLVYAPYYWQSGRFLYFAGTLLSTNGAIVLAQLTVWLASRTRAIKESKPLPLAR
jgi:hypothetical protein